MRRILLKSKIHRATVTAADPDYKGSVSIDVALLQAADIVAHEQVHLLDVDNGARVVTYAIEAPEGTGTVQVNGAAARLIHPGHTVIVVTYAEYDEHELATHQPVVVQVEANNRIRAPSAVNRP